MIATGRLSLLGAALAASSAIVPLVPYPSRRRDPAEDEPRLVAQADLHQMLAAHAKRERKNARRLALRGGDRGEV